MIFGLGVLCLLLGAILNDAPQSTLRAQVANVLVQIGSLALLTSLTLFFAARLP